MPPNTHFLIARFYKRESKNRVNCKLCDYGLSSRLQHCARHVFDNCEKATAAHRQELLDLLRETDDLDVLAPANAAQFHAQQVAQLQRQQAWREQIHQQQLSGQVQQPPDLQGLAHDIQQDFAAASAAEADGDTVRPSK
jgi:hypothetical protein